MKRRLVLAGCLCGGLLFGQAQPREAPLIDANTANLPAQRIGPGDLLAVSVYGSPELTRTVRVGPDGLIRLPMLKEHIRAAGSMPAELEGAIATALAGEGLIVDPFVTVTVADYHSRPVSVMGAVRKPVTFQATGSVTLLDALARAEGLSADAGPEILVSQPPRGSGQPQVMVRRIPVKGLIDAADPELNLPLSGGEEIRVPEAGKIFVLGNVRRPGAFSVQETSTMTVLKAVALAEGLLPLSGKQAVIFRREGSAAKNEISVPLGKIMDSKADDEPLQANDILYVPDAKGRRVGLAALEKILLYGSGATTALIYGTAVH